jgi:predicted TIM-barrel fold metal-dependent hydrolase
VEIIDARVHANQLSPSWETTDVSTAIEAAAAAMDAVGVSALIMDEFAGVDANGRVLPGIESPRGVWRAAHPFAGAAVQRYPARFAYLDRVDPRDPDIDLRMEGVSSATGCVGLRIAEVHDVTGQIADGVYDRYFRLAEVNGIHVFVKASERPGVLEPVLTRHPNLRVSLDHTGVAFDAIDRDGNRERRVRHLLDLARYPNLSLLWCHVERLTWENYPFADTLPILRRVLDAYGAERVMWGSDCTEARNPCRSARPCSWAQTMHYLLDADQFSELEMRALFGMTARALLNWPN